MKDIRFRVCKRGELWAFMANDPVIGELPLAVSPSWFYIMLIAGRVVVNYSLARMERAEAAR